MPAKIDVYVFPSKEARDFKQGGVLKGSVSTPQQLQECVEKIEKLNSEEVNYFWYFSTLSGWLSYREAESHLLEKSYQE